MAISHIPRSVGHNFAPEYQISAVPYIINLASTPPVSKKFIKRDADDLIVAETTSDANGGDAVVSLGKIPLTDLFTDINDQTFDGLKAGFTATAIVKEIKLPKISSWIQFYPDTGAGKSIDVKFGRTTSQEIKFSDGAISHPLSIRCVNLYFGDNTDGKILVGLTTIDRLEFTEVIETFLD